MTENADAIRVQLKKVLEPSLENGIKDQHYHITENCLQWPINSCSGEPVLENTKSSRNKYFNKFIYLLLTSNDHNYI